MGILRLSIRFRSNICPLLVVPGDVALYTGRNILCLVTEAAPCLTFGKYLAGGYHHTYLRGVRGPTQITYLLQKPNILGKIV